MQRRNFVAVAALQYESKALFVQCNKRESPTMSKQLTLASALSVFALSALALFASASPHAETGAMSEVAAPALLAEAPLD